MLTLNKYTALGVSFSIHHFYVLIYKQSSLLICINYSFAILQTSHFYVPTCPINGANVPCSVPVFQLGMSVCQTMCQCFTLMCKRAKKFYIIPDITLHISYVHVSYIKIVLYLISILQVILKKSVSKLYWNNIKVVSKLNIGLKHDD